MRFWFFLLFMLAIDLYAFQAFRSFFQSWPTWWKWGVGVVYWSIPILAGFYMIAGEQGWTSSWPKSVNTFMRAFIFIAYVSKFLVAAVLLIDDLRRLIVWGIDYFKPETTATSVSRNRFLTTAALGLGAIPFTSLIYGMIRNPYRYKVYRSKVNIPDLSADLEGLKIVQISDVHAGSFTYKEPVRNAIDLINNEQADLVFFTGDLVNNTADEMDPYMDVFDKIRAKFGVFSVLGNHDYGDYVRWGSREERDANLERLKEVHKELGWNLLINEHRLIPIKGATVGVIGVENYSAKARFPKYGDLAAAYQGCEASLKLLLSHDPSHWEDQVIKDYKDIDITFSGHTHGMQFGIEIPGWIKWSPIKYMYKQWAGLYSQDKQFLYVNRGLGFLGYPGRVGILPEITVLELAKA